jgi:tetraacyldisaccharide 4'-kinase
LRHFLYDQRLIRSKEGALPTVVLGNLTVGGTGKTPLTELLVHEMEKIVGSGTVGVLSRGYGRKTKGFRWVKTTDKVADVGDEPLMLRRKLTLAAVAVCEDRITGLRRMRKECPEMKWVVCDDALQHRSLIPTLSILVIDATQPIGKDQLLPLGRLRDLPSRMSRFDAAIATRLDTRVGGAMETALKESGWPLHHVHFGTSMRPMPLLSYPSGNPTSDGRADAPPSQRERILAVAGIARPDRFMERLTERFQVVRREVFSDHGTFSKKDTKRWRVITESDRLQALVTTEKDVTRLDGMQIDGLDIRYEPIQAQLIPQTPLHDWLKSQVEQYNRRN